MGLEIISNVGAAYKDVPKEFQPKTDVHANANVHASTATQHISRAETKAIENFENAKYYGEFAEKGKESSNDKLKKAIEKANKNAQKTNCEFKYHEDTNRISISIKDATTGDIIKEIPAEETLDMLSKMWELAGLFVDDKR